MQRELVRDRILIAAPDVHVEDEDVPVVMPVVRSPISRRNVQRAMAGTAGIVGGITAALIYDRYFS